MAYLSPDRLSSKQATVADDLYAVGVVGYEALSGRRPFPQKELVPLAHAILHETPPPLAALRPDVPEALVTAIERAMAREPAQRFDDANAMRAALISTNPVPIPVRPATRVMEAPPPAVMTYVPTGELPGPNYLRSKLWAVVIIAAFLLALILFVVDPPFSSPPPTPASTTTPLPATTTAVTTMPSSVTLPPNPPAHPGPGKKHKGGPGGD
jgi:serine/threonine protein kinase